MQKFEYCMQLLATPLKCRDDPPGGATPAPSTIGRDLTVIQPLSCVAET